MAAFTRPGFWFDQLDVATAALILQLQDDDVEKLRKSGKGKGREDELRDRDVALAIYQQELRYTRLGLENRLTRPDVHQTGDPGFTLLTDAMTEEDMLARDTFLAASLSRGADLDTETEYSVDEEIEAFQLSDGNGTGYFSELEEAVQAAAESSQRATTRLDTSRTTLRDCVACLECKSYNDLPRAACGHWYCRTCLTNLFESAFKDDSLFPPRCCRQEIRVCPSYDIFRRFHQKMVEHNTSDKTYCCRPPCSAFIPPTRILYKQAACPVCDANTCTVCKKASHSGECSSDRATEQLLELAQEQRWQRCFKCQQIVEMERGCNHIT